MGPKGGAWTADGKAAANDGLAARGGRPVHAPARARLGVDGPGGFKGRSCGAAGCGGWAVDNKADAGPIPIRGLCPSRLGALGSTAGTGPPDVTPAIGTGSTYEGAAAVRVCVARRTAGGLRCGIDSADP